MLQEYFMKDPEHTFFGLGDYCEQKKREKDAPYDNIFLAPKDGMEVKVNSFACFQPNETLDSSPVVCPSLLQWAEYLLTPAIETDDQKTERLQKLGGKPMKHYNMTHTTMKSQSRPTRENTADVVTTSSKELGQSDTTIALQQRGNIAFLPTVADMLTSPNVDANEEEPTSVMLLFRIGEGLQAALRTHDSISKKRKPLGFANNDATIQEGMASFVQLVQSMNKGHNQLDFPAAMDWLGRESKTGDSLMIDLTRPDDIDSSSDESSDSSEQDRDDSDYMDGGGDSKPQHKKRPDGNANLNILSSVCGDVIEETSNDHNTRPDGNATCGDDIEETSSDDEEEISVNESSDSNNILPDALITVLNDKTPNHDEVEDECLQHEDKNSTLGKNKDDGVQHGQLHRDKSGELVDSDEEQEDNSPSNTEKNTLSRGQKKRLRKREKKREKKDRDQEKDQEGDHKSKENNQEYDSSEEVNIRKKRKKKRKTTIKTPV
jgi:hypothetical protein